MLETAEDDDAAEWLVHARRGDFDRAWEVSDRILARHKARPDFTRPRHLQSIWTGEPLEDRRVLVRCYHGLGDTIQFARYLPMLHALAREVIVWARPALLPLLHDLSGIDRLIPLHDGAPEAAYDVDLEIMELAHVFRTSLATIPDTVPYLHLPCAELPGPPPRIGIVWRAGDWERKRSMPFEAALPLFDIDQVTWYTLQQNRREHERHPRLLDVSHPDLYEASRRIAALDLLITVDSMPAHLAGALGIPVWTLLVQDADWRWMEDRSDSPWYPTMRLFRQTRTGDWHTLMLEVRGQIISWIETRRRSG